MGKAMDRTCVNCKKMIAGSPTRVGRRSYIGPQGARNSNHEKAFCSPCVAAMDAMNDCYRKEQDAKNAQLLADALAQLSR